MRAEQINYGEQLKRYGNHIWKWVVTPETEEEKDTLTLIDICRKKLKYAPLSRGQYLSRIRDNSISFNEKMETICAGWYELIKVNDKYLYTVEQEYID